MRGALLLLLLLLAEAVSCGRDEAPVRPWPQTIRVAVIGGMIETGMWPELAERYQRLTGNKVELTVTGPKPVVIAAFRKGDIDLITVHACDAMINLVADGLARDPQPWARNDLVIVGPPSDPAQIRGERDAVVALRKILDTGAPILVHASHGADGVLHDLLEVEKRSLPADKIITFDGEDQHQLVAQVAAHGAYSLIGRIPLISGKLKRDGIEILVAGDPRLRRPFLVEVANGSPSPRLAAAADLARFLRTQATQEWLAEFGKR